MADFPHKAQAFVFLMRFNHVAVHAGKSHRLSAANLQQVHQIFIDFSREHHLNNLRGFLVGYAQAVYKLCFLAHLIEQGCNFRAAAVNQNHTNAHKRHQNNIAHDGIF